MINYHNTLTKVITLSAILIGSFFAPAFANELKEICFTGTNAEDDCKESQKAASKPKSGCFRKTEDGGLKWCYFWNPDRNTSGVTLAHLLEDVNFSNAFSNCVIELVERKHSPLLLKRIVDFRSATTTSKSLR